MTEPTAQYIKHNAAICRRTEAHWRKKLARIPDSQEKNIVALTIWWEFMSETHCTQPELPAFLTEYHMRYRLAATVPDLEKTRKLFLSLGFDPRFVARKLVGVMDTFRQPPEDLPVLREIFAERLRGL